MQYALLTKWSCGQSVGLPKANPVLFHRHYLTRTEHSWILNYALSIHFTGICMWNLGCFGQLIWLQDMKVPPHYRCLSDKMYGAKTPFTIFEFVQMSTERSVPHASLMGGHCTVLSQAYLMHECFDVIVVFIFSLRMPSHNCYISVDTFDADISREMWHWAHSEGGWGDAVTNRQWIYLFKSIDDGYGLPGLRWWRWNTDCWFSFCNVHSYWVGHTVYNNNQQSYWYKSSQLEGFCFLSLMHYQMQKPDIYYVEIFLNKQARTIRILCDVRDGIVLIALLK